MNQLGFLDVNFHSGGLHSTKRITKMGWKEDIGGGSGTAQSNLNSLSVMMKTPGSCFLVEANHLDLLDPQDATDVAKHGASKKELQRCILKAEATVREKDEENEMLHQRLQQYENRWLEYEQKMKAMEEMWQNQMRSLQSSLSVAKKSLALDETPRMSDSSVEQCWESNGNHVGNGSQLIPRTIGREMNVGHSVITRLEEEFNQRSQVFADDVNFLVEVKSGQADASLNPDMELRRLKQNFDSGRWILVAA